VTRVSGGIAARATRLSPPAAGRAPAAQASPGGVMWRLRALVAMGHSCTRMAAATGIPAATLRRTVRGEAITVSPQVSHPVTALYEAWWDKQPPQRTRQEKLAAASALQRAAASGWPCPAGLDDDQLDRPGYQPEPRWRHAHGTGIASDYPLAEKQAAS
jgi:hypothetical protein